MSLDKGQMPEIDAKPLRFAVCASRFNQKLVDALLKDCLKTLRASGVSKKNITVWRVPGAAELPYMCNMLVQTGNYDAAIALGVVVAGETPHHMIIGSSTAGALQAIAASTMIPTINGIIVANTLEQARVRTVGKIARGREFAEAAIEMAYYSTRFEPQA